MWFEGIQESNRVPDYCHSLLRPRASAHSVLFRLPLPLHQPSCQADIGIRPRLSPTALVLQNIGISHDHTPGLTHRFQIMSSPSRTDVPSPMGRAQMSRSHSKTLT